MMPLISCSKPPRRVVIGIALTQSNHPAAEMAAREINASGGVRGVPIELMGLEWQVATDFEAAEILKWADRFARTEDLVAVIGHSDSASTLSAAAFYNQHKVPQITTIATNPAITNIGDWTYRLCLSDAFQGVALADYAVRDWGKKRIAVFYVNDAYGRGLAEIFERRARELGAEIVSSRMHRNLLQSDDEQMIRDALANLKGREEPDLFCLFQRIDAATKTIRAIRKSGLKGEILGGDSLGPVSFLKTDAALKEGIRVSQFFLTSSDNPQTGKFVEAHRQYTGREPDYGDAFAYDAVYLVRDAVVDCGFSRECVKSYLDRLIEEKTVVKGAGGTYTLGTDHDARRALYIAEARNGDYHPIKTLSMN